MIGSLCYTEEIDINYIFLKKFKNDIEDPLPKKKKKKRGPLKKGSLRLGPGWV